MCLVLFKLGVSIEVADAKGCTPVIIASQYGRTVLVGYLIGKGASLTMTDREGDTALHWAAFKGDCMSVYLLFDRISLMYYYYYLLLIAKFHYLYPAQNLHKTRFSTRYLSRSATC